MRTLPKEVMEKVNEWNDRIRNRNIDFEPFRITCNFITARCGNDILIFDSVILHFAMNYVLGQYMYLLSADHDERVKLKIPVKKMQIEDNYFFAVGCIPSVPKKVSFWTKRFEKRNLNIVDAKRVSTRMGRFRSYKMPILYDDKKTYEIYGLGKYEFLRDIIPPKGHIGKKAAVGWGECELSLEKVDIEDPLIIDGKLHRPLPVEYCRKQGILVDGIIEERPINPPYYGPHAKYLPCFRAGSRILGEQ